jgi:hypothetical protein
MTVRRTAKWPLSWENAVTRHCISTSSRGHWTSASIPGLEPDLHPLRRPGLGPHAGLLAPVSLAQALGPADLVDTHLTMSGPRSANRGLKTLCVVSAMPAGGDSIEDLDVLRAGGNEALLGAARAPSTIGTWLRRFGGGGVRRLDKVSRLMLVRAWAAPRSACSPGTSKPRPWQASSASWAELPRPTRWPSWRNAIRTRRRLRRCGRSPKAVRYGLGQLSQAARVRC